MVTGAGSRPWSRPRLAVGRAGCRVSSSTTSVATSTAPVPMRARRRRPSRRSNAGGGRAPSTRPTSPRSRVARAVVDAGDRRLRTRRHRDQQRRLRQRRRATWRTPSTTSSTRCMAVHFKAAVGTMSAAFPHMAKRNMGTDRQHGLGGGARLSARGFVGLRVAKAALWSATLSAARKGAAQGITVNAISPGCPD